MKIGANAFAKILVAGGKKILHVPQTRPKLSSGQAH